MINGGIVVLDFGSQYTQLITRRLRELGVFSEICRFDESLEKLKEKKPKGIILSGGPHSVYEDGAPRRSTRELLELCPVMGVCYGMQLLAFDLGGMVESASEREYGFDEVQWQQPLGSLVGSQKVWMSHGDVVKVPPPGFTVLAKSRQGHTAAMRSDRALAVQFHPEVTHTERGSDLLEYFVKDVCRTETSWSPPQILEHLIQEAKSRVPEGEHVLCALSGGVDSTVVGVLLTKALGRERVHCVCVDTGLLRKGEFREILSGYKNFGLNILGVDAHKEFLVRLEGVEDPEKKRTIIGHTFVDVFKTSIRRIGQIDWLAQGTLYPDVIESVSPRGTSVTIKTHHNVGGLPKDLGLKLIEPLRELFKDEVRNLGRQLEIPEIFLSRHPFPGPGLAVRILGPVVEADLEILREADAIFIEEIRKHGLYDLIWQAFCVLLPIKTVGVQGDQRTYDRVICLRAVTSKDGMTADWYEFESKFLKQVSTRITNEVKGVNRVVYDITSKPPGTIEWE